MLELKNRVFVAPILMGGHSVSNNDIKLDTRSNAQYNHKHFTILDSGETGHSISPLDQINLKEIDKNVPRTPILSASGTSIFPPAQGTLNLSSNLSKTAKIV